jgi:hypothetical protein
MGDLASGGDAAVEAVAPGEFGSGGGEFELQTYRFPGPVAEAFFGEPAYVKFIQGPYGSGKTTVCCFALIARAMAMPKCKDGIRRYRALVLRDTYRRMERTVIRSWNKWFPKTVGHWEGGQDRPSRHLIEFEDAEGTVTQMEIEFAAVGDNDVEDFMGGYEITDLFLNEANLQSRDVLTYGAGRCGRFPSMKDLPPGAKFDYGVIGDCNAPEPDSWLLDLQVGDLTGEMGALAELGKVLYFTQPGGRHPQAENVGNLPEGYYNRLAALNALQPWWVARMIDNKSGYSRAGKPVYEEYSDTLHCSLLPLALVPNVPVEFGFDGGLHPGGAAGQWLPNGQWRIVFEFAPGLRGPSLFGDDVARWIEREVRAKGFKTGRAWCDPANFGGVDKASGDLTWVQIIESKTGLKINAAPSNEPAIRQDAVRQGLVYLIDGVHPGLIISPVCKVLRKGFNSDYRFVRVRRDTGDEYVEKPDKNAVSHVHDALQYLQLGARGKQAVIRSDTHKPQAERGGRGGGAKSQGINTTFSVFQGGKT